jgi:hypothetical protein
MSAINERTHSMCSFCGEREAAAVWRGATSEILVCRWCAIETLPKFMADAIVNDEVHQGTLGIVQDALLRADRNFYYGAFLSAIRAHRK